MTQQIDEEEIMSEDSFSNLDESDCLLNGMKFWK